MNESINQSASPSPAPRATTRFDATTRSVSSASSSLLLARARVVRDDERRGREATTDAVCRPTAGTRVSECPITTQRVVDKGGRVERGERVVSVCVWYR